MYTERRASQDLSIVDGELTAHDGEPFDAVAYARFKYGYLPPAVHYGKRLARDIEQSLFDLTRDEPIRIVSAPYKHLPTASHAIAQVLTRELSRTAMTFGYEPPILVPFHKAKMGDDSYAKSSEADRLLVLAALGLRIDESLIRDAHVLIVDDIRITGSAEKTTADYLEPLNPRGVWYLHAARLPQDLGKSNPAIEEMLNQSSPHGVMDILKDVETGLFQLNTRVLRHLLERESADFRIFLDYAPAWILQEMHDAALGNGTAYFNKYYTHLEQLATELETREGNNTHVAV